MPALTSNPNNSDSMWYKAIMHASARFSSSSRSVMKTAAIYVRVSTADQHVESQLYDLRELAIQRGFAVIQEYKDCGVSGRRARRPGLDALIADARRKKFSVVLIAAFDRVAKSVKHFLQVIDEFDSLDIVFISRRENIDTSGPMGRLFLTLIGSIAELETALIRERVLAGMRRAKLDGVRIGRAPMNIDRASIVRDRLSGMTLTGVSRKWGISRSLVCKLVNRARAGDEGLALSPALVVDAVDVAQSSSGGSSW
jgi:DNA invertase Pin-like site-specific DNA recombinase